MRWKLLAGNIVAIVVVGLLAWTMVRSRASEALVRDVDPSVDRGGALLEAVHTQDGMRLQDAVEDAAETPAVTAVFTAQSESDARTLAFNTAESLAREVASIPRRGRPAELVAIVSADGHIIARNTERNQDAGRDVGREFASVAQALQPNGRPTRDYVKFGEQNWLELVTVPVRRDGQVKGALMVGFGIADSASRNDAQIIGVDVGFLFREGDHYSVQSLSAGQQAEKEQLRAWANSPAAGGANLFRGRVRTRVTLDGEDYHVMVVPMPGASSGQAGAVVLRSVTAAQAPASDVAFPALLAMLVGLALAIGYNLYLALYLQRPIEQIEDGLLQVINGNREYRINVEHDELGGVVYRVNQLIGALTDEKEDDSAG